MRLTTIPRWLGAGAAAIALVGAAACSPPTSSTNTGSGSTASSGGAVSAATATSASAMGGMDALVAAAKKEGALNVIALSPTWANYKEILDKFAAKYPEIKITSDQPDASSADEIATAQRLKGQSTAPDVFDISQAANGAWVNDYAGLMTVGYDSAKVPAPTSLADLLKPAYAGKVALNGDPTKAGAAFAGVQMVAIAQGGTPDDPTKGIDWFKQLKAAGNFLPVDPTPATIESGQTPVVFDWSYNQVGVLPKLPTWKMWSPDNASLMAYYVQSINKDAPHPAAARLFQEFLYSPDGQNAWLRGGAKPVLFEAMEADGTIDATAAAALPKVTNPVIPTSDQTDKAKAALATAWAAAIG